MSGRPTWKEAGDGRGDASSGWQMEEEVGLSTSVGGRMSAPTPSHMALPPSCLQLEAICSRKRDGTPSRILPGNSFKITRELHRH